MLLMDEPDYLIKPTVSDPTRFGLFRRVAAQVTGHPPLSNTCPIICGTEAQMKILVAYMNQRAALAKKRIAASRPVVGPR